MYEMEIEKIMGSRLTIEGQIISLESSVQNMVSAFFDERGADFMFYFIFIFILFLCFIFNFLFH